MTKKVKDLEGNLYPEGSRVPETGRYFNAGSGHGVHGGLRKFAAGERFPAIKQGWFWKLLDAGDEQEERLPKRRLRRSRSNP